MTTAEEAAGVFDVGGPIVSVQSHPTGHINDAYLVMTDRKRYLLQRLNPTVFADADAVVANVVVVTEHLRSKGEPTLTVVPTTSGEPSWRDDIGASWRMYLYLEGARPLDVRTPADAAVVGHAFGRFHRVVADLDPARLRVSLPGFHDPQRRMAQLEAAVKSDPRDRLDAARQEVDALHALWPTIGSGLDRLPVHVAHNDAK